MIQVRHLSKRFGQTLAVDGLDFRVEAGEILGFLGPNGAGKTTTLRMLTGLIPPSAGQALIDGHDVVEEPLAAHRAVGYLPENLPLYPDMRLVEYLVFVAGAKGLARRDQKAEADRVMELLGLTPRARQLVRQLSKGFRQRLGLAQALVADPPVLILDEPTIGLDPGQIVEIRALIKGMAGQKTVVLSSHILPEVAATCSRVLIISQGRLVAQGPPSLLSPQAAAGSLRLVAQGPEPAISALLAGLPGLSLAAPAQALEGLEGAWVYQLSLAGGANARAALAKALVEAGHGLIELSPQGPSLEEVFLGLTQQEAPAAREEAA